MLQLQTKNLKHEINRPLFHIKVIGDYYHMTTMDENVNYKRNHHTYCHFFPINLRGPLCTTSTFTLELFIAFSKLRTRVKQYLSVLYTMYATISNYTPLYTHRVCKWHEKSTPWVILQSIGVNTKGDMEHLLLHNKS